MGEKAAGGSGPENAAGVSQQRAEVDAGHRMDESAFAYRTPGWALADGLCARVHAEILAVAPGRADERLAFLKA